MKLIHLLYCLFLVVSNIAASTELPFVIIVASYNNKRWYKKNLDSICAQQYKNFRVIYIDDCSPDGTGAYVEEYLQERAVGCNVTLIKNETRNFALKNIYNAVHSCKDNDIIMLVDGDDWLPHAHVLQRINQMYQKHDIFLTYGQSKDYIGPYMGCGKEYTQEVIKQRKYRYTTFCGAHPRTFYAGLFKKIKESNLKDEDGTFFQVVWDVALVIPMLEMANGKHLFINEILYVYNNINELSDCRAYKPLISPTYKQILHLPRYQPLDLSELYAIKRSTNV